ncbi:MAG: acetyl-CoA carboxylase, carboxyltransferase subunit beta [Deltaproteobacteria bacterium]|nr:acetyl-CoA carboxylase, carboxyltransferase subunit beta [Deltaproteobacteria bacterium]
MDKDEVIEGASDAGDEGDAGELPPKRSVPAGVFTMCPECRETLLAADLQRHHQVCPLCGHHMALATFDRIKMTFDEGSWTEHDAGIESVDPLGFKDSKRYTERVKAAKRKAHVNDALVAGAGTIDGVPVEAGFFVFEFMGGSMGSVVGEKIARVYERALERRVPAMIFSASGGARMQEGVLSLMQMAKTSAAISRLREANVPVFSVLLNPTTGGVAASFAMLGDFIVAEPKALIGFAGARVIQNTIRQSLPPGFQRSEFLLQHGFVDMIVHRHEMKATLARLSRFLMPKLAPVAAAS